MQCFRPLKWRKATCDPAGVWRTYVAPFDNSSWLCAVSWHCGLRSFAVVWRLCGLRFHSLRCCGFRAGRRRGVSRRGMRRGAGVVALGVSSGLQRFYTGGGTFAHGKHGLQGRDCGVGARICKMWRLASPSLGLPRRPSPHGHLHMGRFQKCHGHLAVTRSSC